MSKLPSDFVLSTTNLLGEEEAAALFTALDSDPSLSIRYNRHKPTAIKESDRVKWCENGYYLASRKSFTLDPLFHAGAYYSQEASSMSLWWLLKGVIDNFEDDIKVLDLCAAPGGKSTLLSSLVGDRGVVVANETIKSRANILKENIIKWGVGNVIVTSSDSKDFCALPALFDIVVVDSPCSGEGMFRKDPKSREQWSSENVELCAGRSKRIVSNAIESLKSGGLLVYSTCTFNRKENEEIVEWICDNYKTTNLDIEIDESWGITSTKASNIDCYRFMPHKSRGEGFFVSALYIGGEREAKKRGKSSSNHHQKEFIKLSKEELKTVEKWVIEPEKRSLITHNNSIYSVDNKQLDLLINIKSTLNVLYFGVEVGALFNRKFKPSHPLALSRIADRKSCNCVNLSLDLSLDYLRKQSLDPTLFDDGINLVCYEDRPIGYIKRIGNRTNNLYPKEYRILYL